MNQENRILEYLREHDYITALDAQKEYGIMRLSARIIDLQKRGYRFKKETVSAKNRFGEQTRFTKYSLIEE